MIRIARLKPWTTASPSHQFQQRCLAGGTAKGKAKIKAGITLKRSKITTKKGDSGKGGRARGEERQRYEGLLDQCLNGPTPLRHLTLKQRAREGEREKMGLISKDRQREIDMLKKGNEALGIEKPDIMGTPGMDLVRLGLIDINALPKYQLRVEDGQGLAKEYSRVLMRQLRERQGAESELLRLKSEAVEALLEGSLKEAAMVPDLTPFPVNRFMATLTPPIEGYIEKVMEASKQSSGTEKLR